MRTERTTLTQFLIEGRRHHPEASGALNELILSIALACKAISRRVASGPFGPAFDAELEVNVHGEEQKMLDVVANDIFLRTHEWSGLLAGMVSEEIAAVEPIPSRYPKGKYLLVFDPLDGSSNIDVNVAVGSIFSILRAPRPGIDAREEDFLQEGAQQVCAGYAIYGPATMLVLTVGSSVHGFTLDAPLGEFFLTHPDIAIPAATSEFAINASNSRFWEPAVKRYVDECLAGRAGPRGKDFNMRWIASLVAEAHRILMRGGVFLYPRDLKQPERPGRLRLLYEANPIAFLIEQAGGLASTGRSRILNARPQTLHERIPLVFGSREEVELIERYHREAPPQLREPLFGERGLFRLET